MTDNYSKTFFSTKVRWPIILAPKAGAKTITLSTSPVYTVRLRPTKIACTNPGSKQSNRSHMESHLFNASTQESRQRDLCEFKPNLVSKVSSRSGQLELHSERLFPRQEEEKDSVIRSWLKPTHHAIDTPCICPPCIHLLFHHRFLTHTATSLRTRQVISCPLGLV